MYLPRITGDERDIFERSKHDEGYPSFRISSGATATYFRPTSPTSSTSRSSSSSRCVPLTSQRLGLDLLGEPATRSFVQRAIDTGVATAAIDGRAGTVDDYLVFQAIYADRPTPDPTSSASDGSSSAASSRSGSTCAPAARIARPIDPRMSIAVFARPVLDPDRNVSPWRGTTRP